MTHRSARHALVRVARRAAARRASALAFALAAAPALAQGPTPQGTEFRVNTYTTSQQTSSSVAVDADGDVVVAWQSAGQDGSGYGVYAQRYAASGAPVGSEFRVNTFTAGDQTRPSVAVDADGDVVVAWQSAGQDGSQDGIYAQRYAATGTPLGPEFQVNMYTTGPQISPSVAVDADGDVVVAWESYIAGSFYDVYARTYNGVGTPIGGEFRVSSVTGDRQGAPSVAMDAAGNFVVAWQSPDGVSTNFGIFAQRYAAGGTAVGGEFRVNTVTTGVQQAPSVAVDADGDVVVAWQSAGQDGSQDGIYAQRYNGAGAPFGGEFRVNTYTAGSQARPSVAVDAAGDFAVVWDSGQDGSGYGVYAQRYGPSGAAVGGEFRINTYTTLIQAFAAVAMDSDGDIVAAWTSGPFQGGGGAGNQDGSGYGIFAQRYNRVGVADEPDAAAAGLALAVAPNPTSGAAVVRYETAEAQRVHVSVVDVLGRTVAVLVDAEQGAGPHEVPFDASRLAAGVYAVRLSVGRPIMRPFTVAR